MSFGADHEPEAGGEHVYMVFGDLMAALLGLFVLFFVWAVLFQVDLATDLAEEKAALAAEKAASEAKSERLAALEAALAVPLADGRVTLKDGRIGIAGSVLFDLYSARLSERGAALLGEVAGPLRSWLAGRVDLVMVGGYTDDLPITGDQRRFEDNWQLSTERALTVVRALADAGVPPERLFAAGFGAHHPAVPNLDDGARARNRRVEIVPVPAITGDDAR